VTLVLASAGYPAASSTGDVISGLDDVAPEVEVTHAGTARRDDGAIVTAGGRGVERHRARALPRFRPRRRLCCRAANRFAGRQLRGDIALRAVERTSE
jgi:phosphoribosylamine--glycine ligase